MVGEFAIVAEDVSIWHFFYGKSPASVFVTKDQKVFIVCCEVVRSMIKKEFGLMGHLRTLKGSERRRWQSVVR